MATSALANRNNFIRWNKVSGDYREEDLTNTGIPPAQDNTVLNSFVNSDLENNYQFNDITLNEDGVGIAVAAGGQSN